MTVRWVLMLGLLGGCATPVPAGQQNNAPSYGVVAGTVFRDPGYALPDAKVALLAAGGPNTAKPKKLQDTVTNYRGEFSFRVPPREAHYVVRATMRGYRAEEKEAAIGGADRIDVNLVLVPESK